MKDWDGVEKRQYPPCDPHDFRRVGECDLKHEPITEALKDLKKVKNWLIGIGAIVVIASIANYAVGTTKQSPEIKKAIAIQEQISTVNCKALQSVLLGMGKEPPKCDFQVDR